MDILEYSKKEWRGNTPVAKSMRKGYEAVARKFASIRFVTSAAFSSSVNFQLPENLLSKYDWIKQWQLKEKPSRKTGEISDEIKEYLLLLKTKVGKVFVCFWPLSNEKSGK